VFLQGQFTQDLVRPGDGAAAYGLWLNAKGKVLGDSMVLRVSPEELWIWSEGTAEETLRARLEAYLIADDVVLESVADVWEDGLAVGEDVSAWLIAEGGGLPEPGRWTRWRDGFLFAALTGAGPSWRWLVPAGREPAVPESLPRLSAETLERWRIAAGIPRVPDDIGPGELPQEGGLETDAVSFTKGCYLGQEVMARLHAMGQVRRGLFRVVGSGAPPPVGQPLFQGGRKVGELRSTVADGAGGFVGLALLTRMHLEPAGALATAADGAGMLRLMEPATAAEGAT
jgi:tRNA-modifying protein YgfZ